MQVGWKWESSERALVSEVERLLRLHCNCLQSAPAPDPAERAGIPPDHASPPLVAMPQDPPALEAEHTASLAAKAAHAASGPPTTLHTLTVRATAPAPLQGSPAAARTGHKEGAAAALLQRAGLNEYTCQMVDGVAFSYFINTPAEVRCRMPAPWLPPVQQKNAASCLAKRLIRVLASLASDLASDGVPARASKHCIRMHVPTKTFCRRYCPSQAMGSKPALAALLPHVTALWINGYMPSETVYQQLPSLRVIYTTRICSSSIPRRWRQLMMPFVLEADYDSEIEDWRFEGDEEKHIGCASARGGSGDSSSSGSSSDDELGDSSSSSCCDEPFRRRSAGRRP